MKQVNLEVWFTNGEWRKFPKVTYYHVDYEVKTIAVKFGDHEHEGLINLNNVNFMERIEVDVKENE